MFECLLPLWFQATFYNLTINLNPGACSLWTNNWAYPSALGVYTGGIYAAGNYSNVLLADSKITCAGTPMASSNLLCFDSANPNCGVVSDNCIVHMRSSLPVPLCHHGLEAASQTTRALQCSLGSDVPV